MDLDQLVAESEALSKTCFEISSTRKTGDVVGYWNEEGDGPVIILSETLFADPIFNGLGNRVSRPLALWISGYGEEDELKYLTTPFSQVAPVGEPLYAFRAESLPPIDALVQYGSKDIKAWAETEGPHFPGYYKRGSLADQYEDVYQRRSIFYQQNENTDLVVGGWSMMWAIGRSLEWTESGPDQERVLLFTTLRNSEPWVEAWYEIASGRLSLEEHIT